VRKSSFPIEHILKNRRGRRQDRLPHRAVSHNQTQYKAQGQTIEIRTLYLCAFKRPIFSFKP
jgi:hypothetical protein